MSNIYPDWDDGNPGYDNKTDFWSVIVNGLDSDELLHFADLSDHSGYTTEGIHSEMIKRINDYGGDKEKLNRSMDDHLDGFDVPYDHEDEMDWDFPDPPKV